MTLVWHCWSDSEKYIMPVKSPSPLLSKIHLWKLSISFSSCVKMVSLQKIRSGRKCLHYGNSVWWSTVYQILTVTQFHLEWLWKNWLSKSQKCPVSCSFTSELQYSQSLFRSRFQTASVHLEVVSSMSTYLAVQNSTVHSRRQFVGLSSDVHCFSVTLLVW